MTKDMNADIEKVVFSEEELKKRIAELGKEITEDYKDVKETIYCVGILKGAVVFYTDLVRNINLPVHFDFMIASSYGNGTESSGSVKILKDLDYDVEGKHLIIIEDIIDSGTTMNYLMKYFRERQALLAALEAVAPHGRCEHRLLRLYGPRRIPRGLWPRLCGEIPQSAVHRCAQA